MTYHSKKEPDFIDWKILSELQKDARMSFSELSQKVALSRPAVAERVRRLEEANIITGYSANINLKALGYPISAYLTVSINQTKFKEVIQALKQIPEVTECVRLAGQDDIMVKIIASTVEDIASTIDEMLDKYPECKFITFVNMESLVEHDVITLFKK